MKKIIDYLLEILWTIYELFPYYSVLLGYFLMRTWKNRKRRKKQDKDKDKDKD